MNGDDQKNIVHESGDPSPVAQVLDSEVARTRRDDKEAAQDDVTVIPENEPSRTPLSSNDKMQPESNDGSPTHKVLGDDKGEAVPESQSEEDQPEARKPVIASTDDPNAKWYVVHTFAGHENKVLTNLKQRVESEHLENKIFDILVPTQDKIEIRGGKKETVKEKIFPGYILVKMILDDNSWLTVRTTQGVTSFIGAGNKPIPISEAEVNSIVKFTTQGAAPTFKDVFLVDDTVKIVDGPFSDFIGKVDSVDKEKGRVRVLVSIFGRETPVELDFLQVQKL